MNKRSLNSTESVNIDALLKDSGYKCKDCGASLYTIENGTWKCFKCGSLYRLIEMTKSSASSELNVVWGIRFCTLEKIE